MLWFDRAMWEGLETLDEHGGSIGFDNGEFPS